MIHHKNDTGTSSASRNPIIRLDKVSAGYERGRKVLPDINLEIFRGDFMAITGPNGGGKTTLLRTMLRLLPPVSGKVLYFNDEGTAVKRLHIGYLPQKSGIDTRFPITVEDVVLSGLYHSLRPRITDKDRHRLEEMLATVGAQDFRHRPIGDLSGGQLQRTLLGRALISRPELLVLDEPLSYVDKQFERQIYGLVSDASRHATIILVSHEMSIISTMANRHIIVDHGLRTCPQSHHHFTTYCEEESGTSPRFNS